MDDPENALTDRAYEAALRPELWRGVLEDLATLADGAFGTLATISGGEVRSVESPLSEKVIAEFLGKFPSLDHNPRLGVRGPERFHGFITDNAVMPPAELDSSPFYADFMRPLGYGWCAWTWITGVSSDQIVLSVERTFSRGPFEDGDVARLNRIRPHFARASMLASRLALQRLEEATAVLDRIGIPAAAIASKGTRLSANSSLEALIPVILQDTRERLRFSDPGADKLYAAALDGLESGRRLSPRAQSFPIKRSRDAPAFVVHVIPLKGSARDIFSRATAIVMVCPVEHRAAFPISLLQGLFDLTPSEAKVAGVIAEGASIADFARASGLSHETVRSQVKSVLAKTGTRRQGELTAVLGGIRLPSRLGRT